MTVCVLVTQLWPTLSYLMDCSPPGSSVHGILQARYWSGLLLPSPGIFQTQGLNPGLQADSLSSEPPGNPQKIWEGTFWDTQVY